jgi:serine O-acetyltransferase
VTNILNPPSKASIIRFLRVGIAFGHAGVPRRRLNRRRRELGRDRDSMGVAFCCMEDVRAVLKRDPAVKSAAEVVLCYPGLHALWMHRIAHTLYRERLFLFARLVSHVTRFLTGVEIHPGARLGRRVFIDHGMGVVIGETAEVGDDCTIYKGVLLGGTSLEKRKRHPTVGRGVILGSNVQVLGPIIIGAGSVVVRSVPAHTSVVGVPARVVARLPEAMAVDFEHGNLPDPVEGMFKAVMMIEKEMEDRIAALEKSHGIEAPRILTDTKCAED